jgi:hypothetical protein
MAGEPGGQRLMNELRNQPGQAEQCKYMKLRSTVCVHLPYDIVVCHHTAFTAAEVYTCGVIFFVNGLREHSMASLKLQSRFLLVL